MDAQTIEDLAAIYRDLEALFIADAVRDGALDYTRRFCDAPAFKAYHRVRDRLKLARQAELVAGHLETGLLELRPSREPLGPSARHDAEESVRAFLAAAEEARVVGA